MTHAGTTSFDVNSLHYDVAGTTGKIELDLSVIDSAVTIDSGYRLKLVFTDYIVKADTLTNCIIYDGLTQSNEGKPISCDVGTAPTHAKIYDFSSITGTLKMEVTFTTMSNPFADGTIEIYAYPTEAEYTADNYVAYTTISLTAPTALTTGAIDLNGGAVTVAPVSPGATPTVPLVITIPAGTPFTIASSAASKLLITLETGTSLITATSVCSCSGTNYAPACTVNDANQQIELTLTDAVTAFTNIPDTDITITNPGIWPSQGTKMFVVFELLDATDTATHTSDAGYIALEGDYVLLVPHIGYLHTAENEMNEYSFEVTAPMAMDAKTVLAVSSAEITLPSSTDYAQIDCLCERAGTSVGANCYSNPANTRMTVHFQVAVNKDDVVKCYIPEIQNGAAGAHSFSYSILDIFSAHTFYSSSAPVSALSTVAATPGTATFSTATYSSGEVGSSTTFDLVMDTPTALNIAAHAYVNLAKAGPILTNCPTASSRCYTQVNNIVVMPLTAAAAATDVIIIYTSATLTLPDRLYPTAQYERYWVLR